MSELMNVREVAERLRLSERTIRKRIASGELPAIKLGPETHAPVRVDSRELEAWLYGPQISPSPQQVVAATDGSAKAAATVEPSASPVEKL